MATNAMNFGPAWMRGDASRQARGDGDGRSSPLVHPNGAPQQQQQPQQQPQLGINTALDSSLHPPPSTNGTSTANLPHGRTGSFSYSSILASTPAAAQSPGGDGHGGNGTATNHDKPFKYSRDEMLGIWKANAHKYKGSGIPLEFEKHEAFTSDETLDPALLTDMTLAERDAFLGPINSAKPDAATPGRDRTGRQFSPKTERFPSGLSGTPGRSGAAPRSRALSRGESGNTPYTSTRPQPRTVKSRDYFTGAFGGSSALSGSSPPERDLWGSATKKGSFDVNGKFIVADDMDAQPLESEENGDLEDRENDVEEPIAPQETFDLLPQTDNVSLLALGGRATSRFSSFGLQDENLTDDDSRAVGSIDQLPSQVYIDDDDLNDILSMAADPRAMSPSNQMDRLTSRFAAQSLTPNDPSYGTFGVGPFDSEPIRRDSATMSQFFPREAGMPTKVGLFEHPVVPQQQVLPPVPPLTTRVMIMADKLKWVYKDPLGNVQGPFTGLEMHEWYRGGYFHSTLDVKREDDIAFEPLQTLVKRIGNQREPFLVPLPSKTQTQPIPPRSTTTLSGWNTTLFGEGPEEIKQWIAPPPTIQAAALSGTTLTADQQNALERRKQEEQYMLVRQREIAQQQLTHPPVVHPLHHPAPQHPFVASPAFTGFAPMHGLSHGVTHHVHTPAPVQVQTLPALDTLRTGGSLPSTVQPRVPSPMERQTQGGIGFQPPSQGFMSPWGAGPLGPLSPGMSIHQNQETFSTQSYYDEQTASPVEQERRTGVPEVHDETIETPVETSRKSSVSATIEYATIEPPIEVIEPEFTIADEPEITQETAPTLETEDDLTTTDPPVATPSPARIAPWAQKDEPKKSLSLKQIQEMEAKRASEQARRVAAERQHLLAQQAAAMPIPVAPQPGLPQGSTWGSVAAKGWTAKPAPATPSPGKKTMAQIQKEEEDERTRLTRGKDVTTPSVAVRGYAGAAAAAAKPAMPTAWTMVGPGGRPQPGRPIHSGGINPNIPPAPVASPVRPVVVEPKVVMPPVKASPQPPATGVEDFQKWCRSQLKSLSGVNYDDFLQMLLSLPPNESTTAEIISDTIYNHSSTLDGRHFAEEFLKRRKVLGSALDTATTTLPVSGSGWNEVLKKSDKKDPSGEWNSAFKVVAGKKGRRRG